MFFNNPFKSRLPNADEALAGRATAVFAGGNHAVLGTALIGSEPKGKKQIVFGLGCFGVPNDCFGRCPVFMSRRLAMLAA